MLGAAFDHDGSEVVTRGTDRLARLYATKDGTLIRTFDQGGTVSVATFSPRRNLLLTAGANKTARIWNPRTGRLLRELKGHTGRVLGAAFSPNGRMLATVGQRRVGARLGVPVRAAPHRPARPHELRHERGVQPGRLLARDDERRPDSACLEAGHRREPGGARGPHRLGHRRVVPQGRRRGRHGERRRHRQGLGPAPRARADDDRRVPRGRCWLPVSARTARGSWWQGRARPRRSGTRRRVACSARSRCRVGPPTRRSGPTGSSSRSLRAPTVVLGDGRTPSRASEGRLRLRRIRRPDRGRDRSAAPCRSGTRRASPCA